LEDANVISPVRREALVLGLNPTGYGIVRSLVREGVGVTGAYESSEEFGRLSRQCGKLDLRWSRDELETVERLIVWARDIGGISPVIYANSDKYVQFVADHQDLLSRYFLYHWVSRETVASIVDKSHMSLLCRQIGIVVPRTHVTRPDGDIAAAARSFVFPCLVKPLRSFRSGFPPGLKNMVVQTPDELVQFYGSHPKLCGSTLWQEIIEGADDSVLQCNVLVTTKGLVEATVCIRKIHQYPPGFGSMSFGRTEKIELIVKESVRILEALEYRGLASLEFKHCPADGRYYFIEMNPRLPWYNSLFADAGVNLACLAFRDLTKKAAVSCGASPEQYDGIYWLTFADELRRFIAVRGQGAITLTGWLKMISRSRSFAWWCARDPIPFLRASLRMLSEARWFLLRWSRSIFVLGRSSGKEGRRRSRKGI